MASSVRAGTGGLDNHFVSVSLSGKEKGDLPILVHPHLYEEFTLNMEKTNALLAITGHCSYTCT